MYISSKINRCYAMFNFLFYTLLIIAASVKVVVIDKAYFHIPIFACFIVAYILGFFAALKYEILFEKRICIGAVVFVSFGILVNLILLYREHPATTIRTVVIMAANIAWLSNRICALNHILKIVKKLKESGDYSHE